AAEFVEAGDLDAVGLEGLGEGAGDEQVLAGVAGAVEPVDDADAAEDELLLAGDAGDLADGPGVGREDGQEKDQGCCGCAAEHAPGDARGVPPGAAPGAAAGAGDGTGADGWISGDPEIQRSGFPARGSEGEEGFEGAGDDALLGAAADLALVGLGDLQLGDLAGEDRVPVGDVVAADEAGEQER